MENLPAWPDTIFLEDSILEMDKTGLPLQAKNKEFKSTVCQWKKDRETTLHDIESATEIVQIGLENAKEFQHHWCQFLEKIRSSILRISQ